MARPKSRDTDARILLLSSDPKREWNIFHTLRNLGEATHVKFDHTIIPKKSNDFLGKKCVKDEHVTSNAEHLYQKLASTSGRGGMAQLADQKTLTSIPIFDQYTFFFAFYAKKKIKTEKHDSGVMGYVLMFLLPRTLVFQP